MDPPFFTTSFTRHVYTFKTAISTIDVSPKGRTGKIHRSNARSSVWKFPRCEKKHRNAMVSWGQKGDVTEGAGGSLVKEKFEIHRRNGSRIPRWQERVENPERNAKTMEEKRTRNGEKRASFGALQDLW